MDRHAARRVGRLGCDGADADYTDMPLLGQALSAGNQGNWMAIPALAAPNSWETPNTPPGGSIIAGDTSGNIFFCSQIRATWLGLPSTTNPGQLATDVVRVDVRTWYAKDGRPINAECAWTGAQVDTMLRSAGGTLSDGTFTHSRYGNTASCSRPAP